MRKLTVALVTPALADANNGNWRTAQRWSRMLEADFRVRLLSHWSHGDEDIMLALHARRSASSVAAWNRTHPHKPLVLALTGTDLYRDIALDASAQQSLAHASQLIVLNALGERPLPDSLRTKSRVVLQSCSSRTPLPKPQHRLRALMVGHLRLEKDPQTYFEAARLLQAERSVFLDHIGEALDPDLGRQAQALQASCPNYRWLGALSHEQTRRHIQRAHVLVHPSQLEGGAHVVMEAVRSGTPVLASHIDGNVGMLGESYPGYFCARDATALASRIAELHHRRDQLELLGAQANTCAERFSPDREAAELLAVIYDAIKASGKAADKPSVTSAR